MYVQTCGGYVGWGGSGIETTQVSQCLTNYVKTAFQFKSYFCIVITSLHLVWAAGGCLERFPFINFDL